MISRISRIARRPAVNPPGLRPKSFPKLTSSYYHNAGETGTRLTDTTIDRAFLENVAINENRTALRAFAENDYQLTFGELERDVSKLADGFIKIRQGTFSGRLRKCGISG